MKRKIVNSKRAMVNSQCSTNNVQRDISTKLLKGLTEEERAMLKGIFHDELGRLDARLCLLIMKGESSQSELMQSYRRAIVRTQALSEKLFGGEVVDMSGIVSERWFGGSTSLTMTDDDRNKIVNSERSIDNSQFSIFNCQLSMRDM